MKTIFAHVACFFGFHQYEEVETASSFLKARQCKCCPKRQTIAIASDGTEVVW
jgi:hypothetical protein